MPHKIKAHSICESHKESAPSPKYPIKALRSHTFNTHKFKVQYTSYSLWGLFTPTLPVISERRNIHLRQLAHVKIPYLRTNNDLKEIIL